MVYLSSNKPRYNGADRAGGFESLWQGLQYAIVHCRSRPSFSLLHLDAPFLQRSGLHALPDIRYPLVAGSDTRPCNRVVSVSAHFQGPPVQSEDSADSLAVFLEA